MPTTPVRPYSRAHAILTFGGPLFSATEEWSMSLRLAGTMPLEAADPAAEQVLCEAYAEAIRLQWVKTTSLPSYQAALGWVKFNKVDVNGHYRFQHTNRKDYATAVQAGKTTGTQAPQVSQVITLRTAEKRGLAHSGRMYVPTPAHSVGADGRISTADQTAQATWAKDLINAINAVNAGALVTIMSKGSESKGLPPVDHLVNRVEIGRVYDTMRSRRTSLAEEYAGWNLAI